MNPRPLGPRVVEAGLCLFAASLPLSVAGANIGWAVVLAGLLVCAREGTPFERRPWTLPLFWPLAAYLAAALASSLAAEDPLRALSQLHKDAHKLWLYALLSAGLGVGGPRRPAAALAVGAAAAALIGLGQSIASALGPGAFTRAHAFIHAVTFGEQMALSFLGAAAFALLSGGAERKAGAVLAALSGAALALSNTRGAQLSLVAGAAAFGWAMPRWRRVTAVAAALTVAAVVATDLLWAPRSLVRAALLGRHPQLEETQSQLARVTLWRGALAMAADHPVLGVGPGGYRTALPYYEKAHFDGWDVTVGNAHNLYLHHLAERGLVGLAALSWLLGLYLLRALRRAAERPDPWRLWSAGAAAAFLVMNMTEVALQVEVAWMTVLFVWCVGEAAEEPDVA